MIFFQADLIGLMVFLGLSKDSETFRTIFKSLVMPRSTRLKMNGKEEQTKLQPVEFGLKSSS